MGFLGYGARVVRWLVFPALVGSSSLERVSGSEVVDVSGGHRGGFDLLVCPFGSLFRLGTGFRKRMGV
jgi:hypothetical protein